MGVVLPKNKKSGYLECDRDGCDSKSKSYAPSSPAAPALTVCEAAHKAEGWAFDVGFSAMILGHTVYCPACVKALKG